MKVNTELLLRALLSGAYKMTDGEIDTLLNGDDATDDAAKTALLDKDKTRVADLTKGKQGQTFQDGYKKGKSESLSTLEAELKTHYGIESDATGMDLINAIVEEKAAPATTTDEAVRKSPIYINREKDLLNQIKNQKTEYETKITEQEATFNKTRTFDTVGKSALEMLTGLNPVMPKSAAVAETYKQQFLNSLKEYDFDGEDPKTASILKNGELLKDAHGAVVTLADLVKQQAPNYFEFAANNGGSNAGNGGGGNQGGNAGGTTTGYPAGINKPTNFDDYNKIITDRSIKLEDRQQVTAAWEAEQQSGSKA